jgi:ABC-type sulfate transport system substrate-binding protein
MVAKGNPKAMAGIDDLVRSDVRIFLPNPTLGTGRMPTVIPRYLRPKSHRMSTPSA